MSHSQIQQVLAVKAHEVASATSTHTSASAHGSRQDLSLFFYIFLTVLVIYYSSHRSIISKRRHDIPLL
ncbi:unnamed protein product [Cyberlindnera jadinii]|uniref:Uncharacterized protein n=1 Tax=Cyberlindnera jadinii (strain ATCC 18201 / CBS 1600 / BCRC 20928 / JCM 3617 / NBRC 0987 / NRRL Y-1542) TaxID=983966 RepID=A0A0H5C1L8_CYBJN|nr:unnamed protein product [Cyberlindnera jadinii]